MGAILDGVVMTAEKDGLSSLGVNGASIRGHRDNGPDRLDAVELDVVDSQAMAEAQRRGRATGALGTARIIFRFG